MLCAFVLGALCVKRPALRSGWLLLGVCVVIALLLSSYRFA